MSGSKTREVKPVDADEVKRMIDAAILEYDSQLLTRFEALLKSLKDRLGE